MEAFLLTTIVVVMVGDRLESEPGVNKYVHTYIHIYIQMSSSFWRL